jgi:hypothetical protein
MKMEMDSFVKIQKPQFNVSLFNRNITLSMNRKFMQQFRVFLSGAEYFREEYSDLIDSLANLLQDGDMAAIEVGEGEEFIISSFKGLYSLNCASEFALSLSQSILELAGNICTNNSELVLSAFVAFGRKLESAAVGNFEALQPKRFSNPPVREIVIQRIIR